MTEPNCPLAGLAGIPCDEHQEPMIAAFPIGDLFQYTPCRGHRAHFQSLGAPISNLSRTRTERSSAGRNSARSFYSTSPYCQLPDGSQISWAQVREEMEEMGIVNTGVLTVAQIEEFLVRREAQPQT